jgi:hypothetical protein
MSVDPNSVREGDTVHVRAKVANVDGGLCAEISGYHIFVPWAEVVGHEKRPIEVGDEVLIEPEVSKNIYRVLSVDKESGYAWVRSDGLSPKTILIRYLTLKEKHNG